MAHPSLSEQPYWWQAAPPLEVSIRPVAPACDVAVIGAGYTGLAAALELARAGRSVQVMEKDRPGEGASTRNGGIASGNLQASFAGLIRRRGLERATAIYCEGVEARAGLRRFIRDEGIDCAFQDTGRFTGAMTPRHYKRMGREADLLRQHLGIEAYMVPRAEQQSEIASELYHGGMVRPDIGGLHPALLHRGLLDRTIEAGAVVHAHTAVVGLRRDSDGFELRTERGRVRARDVIVCTNGYTSGRESPWLRRRLVPVASQIVATEPLGEERVRAMVPKGRMLGESRKLFHYFRPSPDGTRLLLGGRAGPLELPAAERAARLRAGLEEIFPGLRGVGLSHLWGGYVAFPFDEMPALTVHDGVHYACGYCGSGVVWARWLGRKAALKVLGSAEAATVFDRAPLRGRPFYFGRPWFLPAAMAWYRARDRLGL